MAADRPVDDVPKIGANLVGATIVDRVAGCTFLENFFTLADVCSRQQRTDRLRAGVFAASAVCLGLGRLNDEAGFFRCVVAENCVGHNRNRKYDKNRAQQRADDLVEFE